MTMMLKEITLLVTNNSMPPFRLKPLWVIEFYLILGNIADPQSPQITQLRKL